MKSNFLSKIIVIGSPGSGKSTMVRAMNEGVNLPVLHLDRIYHIDNDHHITREELVEKVHEFANIHDNWIIDGNYISTVETRVKLANTVVLLNIDTEICLQNIYKRTKEKQLDDIAVGFNRAIIKPEFAEFVRQFGKTAIPKIMQVLDNYKGEKNIVILKNYNEVNDFIKKFKSNYLS